MVVVVFAIVVVVVVLVVLFVIVIATGVVKVGTTKGTKKFCSHYLDFLLC